MLNNFLVGEDPVKKYHVKNLKELRKQIRVPINIIIIENLSRIFLGAAIFTLLIALGLLK